MNYDSIYHSIFPYKSSIKMPYLGLSRSRPSCPLKNAFHIFQKTHEGQEISHSFALWAEEAVGKLCACSDDNVCCTPFIYVIL